MNMKHIGIIALALAAMFAAGCRSEKNDTVVFIGDSITWGWSERFHPEFFQGGKYIPKGISGQVSSQILSRFRRDVLDLKPGTVVILCGTNDIALNQGPYDEDLTMDNFKSMTELARLHGINVVLCSVIPCNHFYWRSEVDAIPVKIESLNERIKAYAETENIPFVDYYSSMVNPEDGSLKADYSLDGVHPNAAGYDVMEPLVEAVLK